MEEPMNKSENQKTLEKTLQIPIENLQENLHIMDRERLLINPDNPAKKQKMMSEMVSKNENNIFEKFFESSAHTQAEKVTTKSAESSTKKIGSNAG